MKYYPVFLRVAGRRCLVVGGGRVAAQKLESLVQAGARVTLISPETTPRIEALAAAYPVEHQCRPYVSGDLRGFFLACAATDDAMLQQQLVREAEEAGVLLNVVDRPELCDFILPSVMERGDLVIATSTSGASPALAKRIRHDLEETYGPEYGVALQLLRRLRQRMAAQGHAADRRRIFSALANSPLLEYLRQGQTHAIDRLLAETVGAGISLATLGMELS